MCEIILDNLYIPSFHSQPTSAAGGGDSGEKNSRILSCKGTNCKRNKRMLRLKY